MLCFQSKHERDMVVVLLAIGICVPNVFSFLESMIKSIFGNKEWPTFGTMFIVSPTTQSCDWKKCWNNVVKVKICLYIIFVDFRDRSVSHVGLVSVRLQSTSSVRRHSRSPPHERSLHRARTHEVTPHQEQARTALLRCWRHRACNAVFRLLLHVQVRMQNFFIMCHDCR